MGLFEDELDDITKNIEADEREKRRREWLLARGVDEEHDIKMFQKHVIEYTTLAFGIVLFTFLVFIFFVR